MRDWRSGGDASHVAQNIDNVGRRSALLVRQRTLELDCEAEVRDVVFVDQASRKIGARHLVLDRNPSFAVVECATSVAVGRLVIRRTGAET